jgi:hypothetical protein
MKIRPLLGYSILALWFLLAVSGFFPQLQIALFGGSVLVPSIALKAALLAALCLAAFLLSDQRTLVPRKLALLWWILFAYLIFDALFLVTYFSRSPTYVYFSYNSYYYFLLVLPLAFLCRGILSRRVVVCSVAVLFLPLAGLGIAQYALGDPLIPTASADGYFEVFSWGFYGDVRAFSLFSSAAVFGHYIAWAGSLGVVLLFRQTKGMRFFGLILVFLAVVTGFATLTRTTYLEIAMAMIAAYLLVHFKGRFSRLVFSSLPILYGLTAVFVAFLLPPLVTTWLSSDPLLSDDTLMMRRANWSFYADLWQESGLLPALFGHGIVQNDRIALVQEQLIDNVAIGLTMHVGLLGLTMWLAFMWGLWRYVLTLAKPIDSFSMAVAAVWSTWLAVGVFNLPQGMYELFLILLLISVPTVRVAMPQGTAIKTVMGSGKKLVNGVPID